MSSFYFVVVIFRNAIKVFLNISPSFNGKTVRSPQEPRSKLRHLYAGGMPLCGNSGCAFEWEMSHER
jgi:hypothetical protein